MAGHAAHATGDATSAYPVAYHQTPAIERSLLTVFFRFIMVIPHLIWSFVYGLATGIAVFLAWFATAFTGRYPEPIYEFVAGYLRFSARLVRVHVPRHRRVPPFDGREHPEYPVEASIPPRQASTTD